MQGPNKLGAGEFEKHKDAVGLIRSFVRLAKRTTAGSGGRRNGMCLRYRGVSLCVRLRLEMYKIALETRWLANERRDPAGLISGKVFFSLGKFFTLNIH